MIFTGFLLKKVSTSFSLLFIGLLAFIVGYWTISQAQKLEKLQRPFPFYLESLSTTTIP